MIAINTQVDDQTQVSCTYFFEFLRFFVFSGKGNKQTLEKCRMMSPNTLYSLFIFWFFFWKDSKWRLVQHGNDNPVPHRTYSTCFFQLNKLSARQPKPRLFFFLDNVPVSQTSYHASLISKPTFFVLL